MSSSSSSSSSSLCMWFCLLSMSILLHGVHQTTAMPAKLQIGATLHHSSTTKSQDNTMNTESQPQLSAGQRLADLLSSVEAYFQSTTNSANESVIGDRNVCRLIALWKFSNPQSMAIQSDHLHSSSKINTRLEEAYHIFASFKHPRLNDTNILSRCGRLHIRDESDNIQSLFNPSS